jgi:hypothetical protein
MLAGDRIIRGIPDWVKYSGMNQLALVSVWNILLVMLFIELSEIP